MKSTPDQLAEQPKPVKSVRVVRLISAEQQTIGTEGASSPGQSSATLVRSRAIVPITPEAAARAWPRVLLWWLVGLIVTSAWDRALWLALSNAGVPTLERFEKIAPWSWLLAFAYFLGLMWPWLGLAILLIARSWVQPNTARVMLALRQSVLLLICSGLAGGLAEVLKLVVRRFRPEVGDGHYTFAWPVEKFFDQPTLGMASSHAAVAVGAALALGEIWPRWRWAFSAGAIVCLSHRIIVGAHYLSDVYVGVSLAVLVFALIRALDLRNNLGVSIRAQSEKLRQHA